MISTLELTKAASQKEGSSRWIGRRAAATTQRDKYYNPRNPHTLVNGVDVEKDEQYKTTKCPEHYGHAK